MNSNSKMLVGLTVVLGLVFVFGLYSYFKKAPPKPEQKMVEEEKAPTVSQGPKKGELGYHEPNRTMKIGTAGLTRATFEKVENGDIFLNEGETLTKLPLTVDEVAVLCTPQDLATASEIDFKQVKKVKVVTPAGVAPLIKAQTSVVAFAQADSAGVIRVHTIAMSDAECSL